MPMITFIWPHATNGRLKTTKGSNNMESTRQKGPKKKRKKGKEKKKLGWMK